MGRRPALVTQAEVSRAIRAMLAAGLKVARVVARPDGVAIETTDARENSGENAPREVVRRKEIIL